MAARMDGVESAEDRFPRVRLVGTLTTLAAIGAAIALAMTASSGMVLGGEQPESPGGSQIEGARSDGRPAEEAESAPPKRRPSRDDDSVDSEFAINRASQSFTMGDYRGSLHALREADPLDPSVAFLKGMSLLALRQRDHAIEQFQVASRHTNAGERTDLDAGIASLEQGRIGEALGSLARHEQQSLNAVFGPGQQPADQPEIPSTLLLANWNDPVLDRSAGRASMFDGDARAAALDALGDLAPDGPRRWNLTWLNAIEYDSNVAFSPSINGLGSVRDKNDGRYVTALFGEYRVVQRDNLVVGLIGSTFDTFLFEFDRFNLQDYMGGAYSNLLVDDFLFGIRYEFHETLLGGNQFNQEHRLVPNASYLEGAFGHTTVFYEFDSSDSRAPALIPAQIQSANVNATGITQAIYTFDGNGRIYLGYRFEQAFADGSDFDRHTHMATGRVEVPFTPKLIGDVDVKYFWDDYENPNGLDFFGRPRRDRRLETRAGLQWYFQKHLSTRLDYTYQMADSNVENLFGVRFYEYQRHVVSTQLIYDF